MSQHDFPSGFMLVQGNRVEQLRDLLVAWTTRHPLAPLENEIILVQSNGIAQWLRLALAASDQARNIAAGLQTLLPSSFIWQVYRTVLEKVPPTSAYNKGPLTWRIFRLLQNENLLRQELGAQAADLTAFLQQSRPQYRAWQFARSVADIFDQYQVYRADWLQDWSAGNDCLRDYRQNPKNSVPAAQLWQPGLWRLLEKDIADQSGRSFLHQQFLQKIKKYKKRPQALPRRVLVFGITSLPTQILEVLHAISAFSQVMFFIHNPCRHYWGDIVEGREMFASLYRRTRERKIPDLCDENSLHIYGHPLLAAWGKQGRDYIRLLDELDQPDTYRCGLARRNFSTDIFQSGQTDSMLSWLQDDILELRSNTEAGKRTFSAADTSIRFHVAHSPQREVEILHDQLLHLFESAQAQKTPLLPADVLVMMPDITTYAPHIEAVFGSRLPHEAGFLPYRINDRPSMNSNQLTRALRWLLALPASRFQAEDIMVLLHVPALRARFSIHSADLDLLHEWVRQAGIRWGLSAAHKKSLGLPPQHTNTWLFGLERMLLGFALGKTPAWNGVEPYPPVSGLGAALAGQLAELVQELQHYRTLLSSEHTPQEWAGLMQEMTHDFFQPTDEHDLRVLHNLRGHLEQWLNECELGGFHEPIELDIVRTVLENKMDASGGHQNFFPGAINFATLMPMRAIPFDHIWLMGMDNRAYPRKITPADIDLMTLSPRPGDRSRRDDDHYLFLEALLSARRSLTISWIGKSIDDNSEIPPSILVGQLREQLAAIWEPETKNDLLAQLTTYHPMKAYSRDYFSNKPGLFTYAEKWRNAHAPDTTPRLSPLPALTRDLTLGIHDLADFLRDPAAAFYKHRLEVTAGHEEELIPADECFTLDGLSNWSILQDIINTVFPAQDEQMFEKLCRTLLEQKNRSGQLAHGGWGQIQKRQLQQQAAELFSGWPRQFPYPALCTQAKIDFRVSIRPRIAVSLAGSLLLTRDKDGAYGQIIVLAGNGAQKHKHLVRPWISHLAANTQIPATTIVLYPEGQIAFQTREKKDAADQIKNLLALWHEGMNLPLPVNLEMGEWYQKDGEKSLAQMGESYEQQDSKAGATSALRRCYPLFSDLLEHGFTNWSDRLYAQLSQTLQGAEHAS